MSFKLALNWAHCVHYIKRDAFPQFYSLSIKILILKSSSDAGGWLVTIINPRRACAARVTVVVLCVCVCVCLSVRSISATTSKSKHRKRYQRFIATRQRE